jgi:hypothetical protein
MKLKLTLLLAHAALLAAWVGKFAPQSWPDGY